MNDIQVIYLDMPTSIRAMTRSNEDDSYTIIINSRESEEQQRKSYEHELNHIKDGDYLNYKSTDSIEYYSHGFDHEISNQQKKDINIELFRLNREKQQAKRQIKAYYKKMKDKELLINNIREYDCNFMK